MVSVKFLISTTAAVMVSTAAFAADMPQPLPQPYQPQMMVMAQPEGAWYLRGDIGVGITNQFERGVSAESARHQQCFVFHQPLSMGDTRSSSRRHRL